MFTLKYTSRFKKDLKKFKFDFDIIGAFLNTLQKYGVKGIDKKMLPHRLKGEYKGTLECHIKPDLLIIWIQVDADNVIKLVRIGLHSDLFN